MESCAISKGVRSSWGTHKTNKKLKSHTPKLSNQTSCHQKTLKNISKSQNDEKFNLTCYKSFRFRLVVHWFLGNLPPHKKHRSKSKQISLPKGRSFCPRPGGRGELVGFGPPLFLKVNPPKQGLFQQKQWSFGFQGYFGGISNVFIIERSL